MVRIEHSSVAVDLGHYAYIDDDCLHGATQIWYTDAGRLDHNADDILNGTGTDTISIGLVDGNPERGAHCQRDGQRRNDGKTYNQSVNGCTVDLSCVLFALLYGGHSLSSVLLLHFGE